MRNEPAKPITSRQARRFSCLCPGAGLALYGHGRTGGLVYLATLAGLASLAWCAYQPERASFLRCAILLIVGLVSWLAEYIALGRLKAIDAPRAGLARHIRLGTLACWLALAGVLASFVLGFGVLAQSGRSMQPTILDGERVIYSRRVFRQDLQRGALLLLRTSRYARLEMDSHLAMARVLALPGDEIWRDEGHFWVNGERAAPAPPIASSIRLAVEVPVVPARLIVPEGRYFVVPENGDQGWDSRVLSWVRWPDLVATRMWLASGRGVLQRLE